MTQAWKPNIRINCWPCRSRKNDVDFPLHPRDGRSGKALLRAAHAASDARRLAEIGGSAENVQVDFSAVMKRKNKVVKQLRKGVEGLVAAKKIKVIKGEAKVVDSKTVMVGKEKISADALIIATGSVPSVVPIPGLDKVDAWPGELDCR